MESLLPLLLIIISFAITANRKSKEAAAKRAAGSQTQKKQAPAKAAAAKAAKPGAARTAAPKEGSPASRQEAPAGWEEKGGSIVMPPMEAHEHEGKPMPCPAEEREAPRPRPSQQTPGKSAPAVPGLQPSFSRNSVLQAVVMSEILKRPEFRDGRRVIR